MKKSPSSISYIDSHCHLDREKNLTEIINRSKRKKVTKLITIGTSVASSTEAISIAKENTNIYETIGIHPSECANISENHLQQLGNLFKNNRSLVKAFGEIGLDYFYKKVSVETQRKIFRKQLELAEELDLPVVIHNRNADDDCYKILADFPCKAGLLFHCFGSNWQFAKKVLDRGAFISISGIVTFKNAPELQEIATKMPLDRMLIETDSPFLAPVPLRGKKNEPSYLPYIAVKIAELRELKIEELSKATVYNTEFFFKL